jgi:hypothetical protein
MKIEREKIDDLREIINPFVPDLPEENFSNILNPGQPDQLPDSIHISIIQDCFDQDGCAYIFFFFFRDIPEKITVSSNQFESGNIFISDG